VFQDENYGPTYTVKLDEKKVVAEGKRMANDLVKKMRKTQGMKTTPIHVALYLQEKEGSPVSGHYLSSAFIGRGNQISANDWKNYNERYYYYPSARATNDVRDDAAKFDLFKDRLEDYFPNYTGMMGEGFYQEDELKKLEMKIPVQFYGKAELVAFVQYVTYLLENRWEYNRNIPTTITVTNLNGDTEAMLFLDPDTKKPIVKIR
ncbi:CamS family sex pheromone protein, partial [Exiguobacterium sp. A1_3_1]